MTSSQASFSTPSTTPAAAFAGSHQPRPLKFDPARLDGLSERLIRSHHENNYAGSVKTLNMIEGPLVAAPGDKDLPPVVDRGLKREDLHRTGSVVLHELYFDALGGDGQPGGEVATALGAASLHNYWAWDHMHQPAASVPLLPLDMYEHAFHMDYGSAAAKYVDAFMRNIDWAEVGRRYRRVSAAMLPA